MSDSKIPYFPLTHVCIYKNCPNRVRVKGVSYFSFPVKDKKRTEAWLINSGNADLLSIDFRKLKYSLICEKHFSPEYLSNNCFTRMLIKNSNAVPIQYVEDDVKPEIMNPKRRYRKNHFKASETLTDNTKPMVVNRTYSRKDKIDKQKNMTQQINIANPVHQIYNLPLPEPEDPNIIKEEQTAVAMIQMKSELNSLREEVSQLKLRLQATADLCIRMKKKKFTSYVGIVDDLLFNKSIFVKTFVRMQTYNKKRKWDWSINEKHFSISFYRRSPKLYKFFLLKLKFVLPNIKTVKYWMNENRKIINEKTVDGSL